MQQLKLHFNFTETKEAVQDARTEAHDCAARLTDCKVIRSRGAWVRGAKSGEVLNDSEQDFFKNKTELVKHALALIELGADTVTIEGGFDGASSVRDMNDGQYDPWIAEWEVIFWTAAAGVINTVVEEER